MSDGDFIPTDMLLLEKLVRKGGWECLLAEDFLKTVVQGLATKSAVDYLALGVDENIVGNGIDQIDGSSGAFETLEVGELQPRHLDLFHGFQPGCFLVVE